MSEWMTDLKDRDPSIRERALTALRAYGPEARDAVPYVIKAINDTDMSLRVNAILTLGFIGMEEKDRQSGIDALKRRLSSAEQQGTVRFQAIRALGRLGRDASDAASLLIRATTDQNCWEIRAAAVTALSTVGWNPKGGGFDANSFKAALELAAQDKCLDVRVQALLTLIAFGAPADPRQARSLENALHTMISDKRQSRRIVLWSRVALISMQPADSPDTQTVIDRESARVAEFLQDPDLETRVNAARAFATLGEKAKSQVNRLTEALGDKEPQMLHWTCVALAGMGPAALPAFNSLKRLEQHPDPVVRDSVRTALDKIVAKAK